MSSFTNMDGASTALLDIIFQFSIKMIESCNVNKRKVEIGKENALILKRKKGCIYAPPPASEWQCQLLIVYKYLYFGKDGIEIEIIQDKSPPLYGTYLQRM